MKSTGNMDFFLLVLTASPVRPEPLLGSMEEAMEPAEPSNGAGLPKGPGLVSLALCSLRDTEPTGW